jgi:hypothetical protein
MGQEARERREAEMVEDAVWAHAGRRLMERRPDPPLRMDRRTAERILRDKTAELAMWRDIIEQCELKPGPDSAYERGRIETCERLIADAEKFLKETR